MVDERAEFWRGVEQQLRSALEGIEAPFDSTWVTELLDHNELGLAFEAIALAAASQGASEETWTRLRQAMVQMGLSAEDEEHGAAVSLVDAHFG